MLFPDHADMGSKTALPDNDSSPTPAVSTLHTNIGPQQRAKVETSLTHSRHKKTKVKRLSWSNSAEKVKLRSWAYVEKHDRSEPNNGSRIII